MPKTKNRPTKPITIAIQPFNGLSREEIFPIVERLEEIYRIEVAVLKTVNDSGIHSEGVYLGGMNWEEMNSYLYGINDYKLKLGITRELIGSPEVFTSENDGKYCLISLHPKIKGFYLADFGLQLGLYQAIHETGHMLGMDHCWENGGKFDEYCYMGTNAFLKLPKLRFCEKHKFYLLKKELLKIK